MKDEEKKAIELLEEQIKEYENGAINSYYKSDRELNAEYSIAYKKLKKTNREYSK